MEDRCGRRIVLKQHRWELPALISLVAAVTASLYAVTPGFKPLVAGCIYLFSMASGIWSIAVQIQKARATIVNFSKDDWKLVGENLVLEIESEFMLFRVETRKDDSTFEVVWGGTETSENGKVTRVFFSSGIPEDELAGRIVVR